jgi:hypothetical protein
VVLEPEFARVLKVCSREGSTLSAILRDAWDRGHLRVLTRKDPLKADGAHVSVIGHITVAELRRYLTETEVAGGFGNRFLYPLVERKQRLPRGGNLNEATLAELGRRTAAAVKTSSSLDRLERTPDANLLWDAIYNEIDDNADGPL